jgi:hypothetical protein
MPYVGDKGRDLIVHHPSGKIIVECKHQRSSTVGRPVVQKLDSAIRQSNARKGIIISTGRVSKYAHEYADQLSDISIEIIESAKLSYMAEKTGLLSKDSYTLDDTSFSVKTISDNSFPEIFLGSIFSEPRFNSGQRKVLDDFDVIRNTNYEGFYIADFSAHGKLDSSVKNFTASWEGTISVDIEGKNCHSSKIGSLSKYKIIPLGKALEISPGSSSPPQIQPHEAMSLMKNHVVKTCYKTVRYRGRNNVTYVRKVKPKKRSIQITNIKLVYFPKQSFELRTDRLLHTGNLKESDDSFHIRSNTLSECCICGRTTKSDNQVFCYICHQPAHVWTFFTPDSFRCEHCGATVCRNHTLRIGKEKVCIECANEKAVQLRARGFPHLIIGIVISALIIMFPLVIFMLQSLGYDLSWISYFSETLVILAFIVFALAWAPYIHIRGVFSDGDKNPLLSYPIRPSNPASS